MTQDERFPAFVREWAHRMELRLQINPDTSDEGFVVAAERIYRAMAHAPECAYSMTQIIENLRGTNWRYSCSLFLLENTCSELQPA